MASLDTAFPRRLVEMPAPLVVCRRTAPQLLGAEELHRELSQLPHSDPPLQIADLGCGDAALIQVLAKELPALRFLASDITLKEVINNPMPNIQYSEWSLLDSFPFRTQSLSGAILGMTVSAFNDRNMFSILKKASEALRQNAPLFVKTTHHEAQNWLLNSSGVREKPMSAMETVRNPHLTDSSCSEEFCRGTGVIPAALKAAGFTIAHIYDYTAGDANPRFFGVPANLLVYRLFISRKAH